MGKASGARMLAEVGFVMTRCMRTPQHAHMWREAVRCIRRNHPAAPIVLLDDHSEPGLLSQESELAERRGVEVVHSTAPPGTAELLPLLYLASPEGVARFAGVCDAVLMHDSMFLQEPLPPPGAQERSDGFRFLWHFGPKYMQELAEPQHRLLQALAAGGAEHDAVSALRTLRDDSPRWLGCFGVAMRVSPAFAARLVHTYHLHTWLQLVRTRDDRSALERVVAVLCHHLAGALGPRPGLLGDILAVPGAFVYQYEHYARGLGLEQLRMRKPGIIKVWSTR